jgi:hypothetical protein
MNKYFIIFFILFFPIVFPGFAQEAIPIDPTWAVAFGSKQHTSRDAVVKMEFDADSNLVIAGSVERDSSFSDIMVQKYSRTGHKIWQKRYSSGKNMDFDTPLDIRFDNNNNIIVLGSYATGVYNFISPVLFKMDPSGNILWSRILSDINPVGSSIRYSSISILGNDGIRLIAYTTMSTANRYMIYEFSKEGNLISNSLIPNVNNGGVQGIPGAISSGNNGSVFVYNMYDNGRSNSLFWVTELTGSNPQYYELNITTEQKGLLWDAHWEVVKSDRFGNFYFIDNFSGQTKGYHIFKITSKGKFYIYTTLNTDHFSAVENLCFKNSDVLLIGRQTDGAGINSTFLVKLDSSLKYVNSNVLSDLANYVPQNIVCDQDSVYAILDNETTGTTSVIPINESLQKTGEYLMNFPAEYIFSFTQLLKTDNQNFIGGTILKPKFAGSDYLSETEFYFESYSTRNGTNKLWNQIYTDTGTSLTVCFGLFKNKDIFYILTDDALGPEYLWAADAPKMNYLYKVDSLGNKLWKIPLDYTFSANYNSIHAIDHNNNLYLLVSKYSTFYLLRVSQDGKETKQSPLGTPHNIFVDKNNHVYVNHVSTDEFQNTSGEYLTEFDSDFNLVKKREIKGKVIQFFQLEDNDSLYYYTFDPGPYGDDRFKTISLYVNNNLRWSHKVNMSSPYREYVISDYNKKTGTLYFITEWEQVYKYVQRLTLKNNYSYIDIGNTPDQFSAVKSFLNDNLIVNIGSRWQLYKEDLSKKSTIVLETYGKSTIVGNFLFIIKNGDIMIFDNNMKKIGEVTNSQFNSNVFLVDNNFDYFNLSSFGHSLPIEWASYMAGYQCKTGGLSAFKLSKQIDFVNIAPSDPQFLIDLTVHKPNDTGSGSDSPLPNAINEVYLQTISHYMANDELVILRSDSNSNHKSDIIQLYNLSGVQIISRPWLNGESSSRIQMNNLAHGFYILHIISQSDKKLIYHAKIIW